MPRGEQGRASGDVRFAVELGDAERRFSDQEIRAITKRIEAMSEEMGATVWVVLEFAINLKTAKTLGPR
jgi:hypothetical protein